MSYNKVEKNKTDFFQVKFDNKKFNMYCLAQVKKYAR